MNLKLKRITRYLFYYVGIVTVVALVLLHSTWEAEDIRVEAEISTVKISYKRANFQMYAQSTLREGIITVVGKQRAESSVFTVGIPTVRRIEASYLLKTIKSLIKETSESDMRDISVIIFLADLMEDNNNSVLKNLTSEFGIYFQTGFLRAIMISRDLYPDLSSNKSKYGDSGKRISWRSKLVYDVALLCAFAKRERSKYYLHLEDDVISANDLWPQIGSFIDNQEDHWTFLEFSIVGFIGKLLKVSDLEKFSQFLVTFYSDMPVDWLLPYFQQISGQRRRLLKIPPLFRHIGKISSLVEKEGSAMVHNDALISDDDVFTNIANPKAIFITPLKSINKLKLDTVYTMTPNDTVYFHTEKVRKGDEIFMIFKEIILPTEIKIITGNRKYPLEILQSGWIDMAKSIAAIDQKTKSVKCSTFTKVAQFENGLASITTKSYIGVVKCLRIYISEDQENDLVISSIYINSRHQDTVLWEDLSIID